MIGGPSLSISYIGTFLVFLYIWLPFMLRGGSSQSYPAVSPDFFTYVTGHVSRRVTLAGCEKRRYEDQRRTFSSSSSTPSPGPSGARAWPPLIGSGVFSSSSV